MNNNSTKIPEHAIASFFVGFMDEYRAFGELDKKKTDVLFEEIIRTLCPSMTVQDFYNIEHDILQIQKIRSFISQWDKIWKSLDRFVIFRECYDKPTIKLTQEMIFAYFVGIANSMPIDENEKKFNKINLDYLKKIVAEFCPDADAERLCDIEWFFYENELTCELRERIIMMSGIRPSWSSSYYNEQKPSSDEEAMLKNFQKMYR